MRSFVGILLIALGALAFVGAQRTWKPDRKLVGELDSDSDPVWREPDEWFEEPDDVDRLGKALAATDAVEDPVEAAAMLACRVTRAQAFSEGNKRTALLPARWLLDPNGQDGSRLLPAEDRGAAALLVRAAAGADLEAELLGLLRSRAETS